MSSSHSHHTSRPADDADVLHEHASTLLSRFQQRYTSGRRRLVMLLAEAGQPLSLPDILGRDPELPQSSVYRNLDVLERVGLVNRLAVGADDHARFELSEPLLGHHHHLICIGCGTIEDVHLDEALEAQVEEALASAASAAGFSPVSHSLDLHGHCKDCAD